MQSTPIVARPLCGSVRRGAARASARRIAWAVVAVGAATGLFSLWPGTWPAVAALVAPDLPLIVPGAWAERGRLRPAAVPFYNLLHAAAGPVLLSSTGLAVVLAGGGTTLLGLGAAWLLHVAADRTAGYDLRTSTGDIRQ